MLSKESTIPTLTEGYRRVRRPNPCLLQQVEGPGAPRWIKLDREEMAIGRGTDAAIQLNSERVSREHAFFRSAEGECTVEDNDSRNGLFLNGVRIHSAVLRTKDVLQIADCIFTFHEA
jgi:pSer/pThr/pTyr-binding forkhead associated (FHA) protein